MKILHVYARNLQVFVDAVEGTECKLNASRDVDYLRNSLTNFNARDVLGLVVWSNPMTRKCIELVNQFDSLFVFKRMPIVIISQNVHELWAEKHFKIKNSKVFLLESDEDSISDLDVSSIFTTILAYTDSAYDLSDCPAENVGNVRFGVHGRRELVMSAQLTDLLKTLEGGKDNEIVGAEEGS